MASWWCKMMSTAVNYEHDMYKKPQSGSRWKCKDWSWQKKGDLGLRLKSHQSTYHCEQFVYFGLVPNSHHWKVVYPSKAISAQSNLDLFFRILGMPPNGGSGDVLFFCFRLYNPFLMVPLMKLLRMRWSQFMGCRVIGRYHRRETQ